MHGITPKKTPPSVGASIRRGGGRSGGAGGGWRMPTEPAHIEKKTIRRTVRQEGISRKQSYLVSSDREQLTVRRKRNRMHERGLDTRSAQKSVRLTNTKTNVIRGIEVEIEERHFFIKLNM